MAFSIINTLGGGGSVVDPGISQALGAVTSKSIGTVTIGTAETEIVHLSATGWWRIAIHNAGATALNSFKIQQPRLRVVNGSEVIDGWDDILASSDDYLTIPSSVSGFLLRSDDTVSPTTLAANGSWSAALDTRTCFVVRLTATVASGTTTIGYIAG